MFLFSAALHWHSADIFDCILPTSADFVSSCPEDFVYWLLPCRASAHRQCKNQFLRSAIWASESRSVPAWFGSVLQFLNDWPTIQPLILQSERLNAARKRRLASDFSRLLFKFAQLVWLHGASFCRYCTDVLYPEDFVCRVLSSSCVRALRIWVLTLELIISWLDLQHQKNPVHHCRGVSCTRVNHVHLHHIQGWRLRDHFERVVSSLFWSKIMSWMVFLYVRIFRSSKVVFKAMSCSKYYWRWSKSSVLDVLDLNLCLEQDLH